MRSKTPEQIARQMLRECARKARVRLQHPHADVTTIAKQLEQTARLALAASAPSGGAGGRVEEPEDA